MIFYLENLTRDYCNEYSNEQIIESNTFKALKSNAQKNIFKQELSYRDILDYTHLGDLIDIIKSKKFKESKTNTLSAVNPSRLILHRNNIMHSRSISNEELETISNDCNLVIEALDDSKYKIRWNKFIQKEISDYRIPILHLVYPLGKNFDKLVGRENELKKLKSHLVASIPRSITGQGGLGKTAIVLQLVEDYLYDPKQPFENIYFMSFKDSAFENGKITRFEKSIGNHKDLILRLASFMKIDTEINEFIDVENMVWEKLFKQDSLLILDNLETEIVKSNLNEFTQIAEKFIMSFPSKSRLIITSRFGLGDREAKTPLHTFTLEDTKTLIKNYLGDKQFNGKKFNDFDWEWIQTYTGGNPGLIIALANFLGSTQKKVSDIRIEFNSKYTEESNILHNQYDEFINFCFENTIDSMNINSQKFLSVLCYICSESNLSEISEEFLTYLKEEIGLKALGEENLRSQVFSNIGFLQPLPLSDKFIINELLMVYLDRNNSDNIFNMYKVNELKWKPAIDELINFINEIQFEDEVTIDYLLSELYMSKFRKTNESKYLIKSYFCSPTITKLIKIYNSLDNKEIIKKFELIEKVKHELSNSQFKNQQEKVIHICIKALKDTYRDIVYKKTNKLFQSDLVKYFNQLETLLPSMRKKDVSIADKKTICILLNNLLQYDLVDEWTKDVPELINERFFMLFKLLNKNLNTPKKVHKVINECDEILKRFPLEISTRNQGQYKLYKAKAIYKSNPANALLLLNNYSMYYVSDNVSSTILYLESLLLSIECHILIKSEYDSIKRIEDRFLKIFNNEELKGKIFERNRDKLKEKYNNVSRKIIQRVN